MASEETKPKENDVADEKLKKAWEEATAALNQVKHEMNPGDAREAIQEIEELRDAEGFIE